MVCKVGGTLHVVGGRPQRAPQRRPPTNDNKTQTSHETNVLSATGVVIHLESYMVTEKEKPGGKWDRSLWTERACWYPSSSNFCRSVNTLCLFGMSDSVVSNVPLRFVHSSEGRKEDGQPFGWELAIAGRSAMCIDIFQPQTHQHWIPRQQNKQTDFDQDQVTSSQAPSMKGGACSKLTDLFGDGIFWMRSDGKGLSWRRPIAWRRLKQSGSRCSILPVLCGC